MSQFDQADDPERQPAGAGWNLAELVAVGLLAILVILMVTSIISALATQSLFSSGTDGHFVVALALERAGSWALPQSAAIFVLGSLALAWWQIESWTNDDGDPLDTEAFVHLRRAAIVTRIDLVFSLLTIVGGVLIVVGTALRESSPQDWGLFAEDLGFALGSIVLGVLGVVAARRLEASGLAAIDVARDRRRALTNHPGPRGPGSHREPSLTAVPPPGRSCARSRYSPCASPAPSPDRWFRP